MKFNVFLACFIGIVLQLNAQVDDVTICRSTSTEKFAMLASNKGFRNEHALPRAYVHYSQAGGKMITFKGSDGVDAKGYLIEAKSKTDNWILVFQEWWGLNDNIKRQSEDLYNALGNVNVIALDMYDGNLATVAADAQRYMQQFRQERGDAIVKGAITYAGANAKIGTIGWCFGGGQALLAAITAGKQGVACVMYYGMPVEDVGQLKTLNTDVLNIWGTKDQWINKTMMDKFAANMKEAGKGLTIKPYDANHGFANPSNPMGNFDQAAYRDAWAATLSYFKERMK
jgi:carboxymethylenebutenolidase